MTASGADRMVSTAQPSTLQSSAANKGVLSGRTLGIEDVPVVQLVSDLFHGKGLAGRSSTGAHPNAHDVPMRVLCGNADDSVSDHQELSIRPVHVGSAHRKANAMEAGMPRTRTLTWRGAGNTPLSNTSLRDTTQPTERPT